MTGLSKREQINKWLDYYGCSRDVEIEPEAEDLLLVVLMDPGVSKVYVDDEGGLVIESDGSDFQGTDNEY